MLRLHVLHQLSKHQSNLIDVTDQLNRASPDINLIPDIDLCTAISSKLSELSEYEQIISNTRITNKLNHLYHGHLLSPKPVNNYINLPSTTIDHQFHQLLSHGYKCHFKPKFDPITKQMELKILYYKLLALEEKGSISINSHLADQLRAEATKNRDFTKSTIINKDLSTIAKNLKHHPDIIVRRADKANIFVIMDRSEYKNKLDHILSDPLKFRKITKNPILTLKSLINKLIATVNKDQPTKILSPITGEHSPCYIYGTVKIHKPNNPLRPIISQIPTPVYHLAKQLNAIITPYLPSQYVINSTDEFLQLVRTIRPNGTLASLDVDSLFTNVPINKTIELICNNVYQHPHPTPQTIPKPTLAKLLSACTSECPFQHIDGTLYLQPNGVGMGSPAPRRLFR